MAKSLLKFGQWVVTYPEPSEKSKRDLFWKNF